MHKAVSKQRVAAREMYITLGTALLCSIRFTRNGLSVSLTTSVLSNQENPCNQQNASLEFVGPMRFFLNLFLVAFNRCAIGL